MSWAFITALRKNPNQSYVQLLNSIREELEGKYDQKPQLSCSHPLSKSDHAARLYCLLTGHNRHQPLVCHVGANNASRSAEETVRWRVWIWERYHGIIGKERARCTKCNGLWLVDECAYCSCRYTLAVWLVGVTESV
jgi:hypothetical protein